MSVTPDLVDRIAHLSRLTIDEKQLDHITADFNKILNLIDQIDEFTLSDESKQSEATQQQALREDLADTTSINPDLFQKNAPSVDEKLYLVPDVIDTNEA